MPPANAQEAARNNIIREMVETERKYVQDLEIMQVRISRVALLHRLPC
jgi:cell division control protein 24